MVTILMPCLTLTNTLPKIVTTKYTIVLLVCLYSLPDKYTIYLY